MDLRRDMGDHLYMEYDRLGVLPDHTETHRALPGVPVPVPAPHAHAHVHQPRFESGSQLDLDFYVGPTIGRLLRHSERADGFLPILRSLLHVESHARTRARIQQIQREQGDMAGADVATERDGVLRNVGYHSDASELVYSADVQVRD